MELLPIHYRPYLSTNGGKTIYEGLIQQSHNKPLNFFLIFYTLYIFLEHMFTIRLYIEHKINKNVERFIKHFLVLKDKIDYT